MSKLNIKFNNPNTPEDTAKALIHTYAMNLADTALHRPTELPKATTHFAQAEVTQEIA